MIGGAALFGAIVEDVLTNDPSTITDQHLAQWLHDHATPGLTTVMEVVTFLGSRYVIGTGTLAVMLALAMRRERYHLVAFMLAVPGGSLFNVLLKEVFHRHRPVLKDPLLDLTDYSLPSGHAIAAILFYGSLAVLLAARLRRWRSRVAVMVLAGVLILLIDFSRMYLGVHFLSDVLAADAEGLAWLGLVWTAVNVWRHQSQRNACG
jgi:undecaprenyl-diphosphatase